MAKVVIFSSIHIAICPLFSVICIRLPIFLAVIFMSFTNAKKILRTQDDGIGYFSIYYGYGAWIDDMDDY